MSYWSNVMKRFGQLNSTPECRTMLEQSGDANNAVNMGAGFVALYNLAKAMYQCW